MGRISVCIPTYQSAGTLRRAIESVLRQQGCEVELVIGDNASTDDTAAVVAGFDQDRLTYVCHANNIGYPANVNSCLERARGDYVFILCADDFLIHEGVLAELLQELQSSQCAVASHVPFQLYRQQAGALRPVGRPFSPLSPGLRAPAQVLEAFTDGRGCFGWGWLFKRELVGNAGLRFEVDHDMAPDTMFWLSLSMRGPVAEAHSGRPGYAFVMHEDSLGGRIFNERALEVYEQLLRFEVRLFDRLRKDLPELEQSLAGRQFRYSTSEFAGLVQKGFTEDRLSRWKALSLLCHAARRHPRAALNARYLRNLLFILLPASIRRRIVASRSQAVADAIYAP